MCHPQAAKPYPSLELAAKARAKRGYLSLENATLLCHRGIQEYQNAFYWRHDRRLLTSTPLRMTENQIISCLQSISAKSCVIWGEDSSLFANFDMERRTKAVPNLKSYYLKGGHHLHMEKPDTLAQCLVEFYEKD